MRRHVYKTAVISGVVTLTSVFKGPLQSGGDIHDIHPIQKQRGGARSDCGAQLLMSCVRGAVELLLLLPLLPSTGQERMLFGVKHDRHSRRRCA